MYISRCSSISESMKRLAGIRARTRTRANGMHPIYARADTYSPASAGTRNTTISESMTPLTKDSMLISLPA